MKSILAVSVGLLLTLVSKQNLDSRLELTSKVLLVPPKSIVHMHLGYREALADTLWIRVIQDLDQCEQDRSGELRAQLKPQNANVEKVELENSKVKMDVGETEPKEAQKKETTAKILEDGVEKVLKAEQSVSKCNLGWVYHMLDRVTDLSPKFKLAYIMGGTFLSVVVDDREGARLLFDKGVKQFPNDWSLAYRAAYHYLYEIRNAGRAAQLLEKAGRNGAPVWVFSLAARLYEKSGRAELGITVLEDMIRRNPKGFGNDRIGKRLFDLYMELNEVRQAKGLPIKPIPDDVYEKISEAIKIPNFDPYKDQ